MAECEKLEGCPFFHDKMRNMPAMADIIKKRYCLGSNAECARYKVFRTLGPGTVPDDLFPGDQEYAERLIAGAG